MVKGGSPYVRYALAKATRKGEDCIVGCPTQLWPAGAWRATPGPRTYGLYAVIDGHNGAAAAEFTAAALPDRFALELRRALAELDGAREDAVQAALGATFLGLDAEFGARGELSGATLTVCVIAGWHVSVANIGDSRAILDAGGNEVRRPRAASRSSRRLRRANPERSLCARPRPRRRAHTSLACRRACTTRVVPRAAVRPTARAIHAPCFAFSCLQIMQLTYDFRLEDSPEERARITAAGAILRRLAESGRGPCEAHEVRARVSLSTASLLLRVR